MEVIFSHDIILINILYYLKYAASVTLQDMELLVPFMKVASIGLRNKWSWNGSVVIVLLTHHTM